MKTYYIDPLHGRADADGLTPKTAINDYRSLPLESGDAVLFKRGSFIRARLETTAGVTYSAYGEGDLPTFCGSVDASAQSDWEATDTPNVWKCLVKTKGDVGNFVFNNNECTAALKWTMEELCCQGDFYDTRFGEGKLTHNVFSEQNLYLYSVGNPAQVYSHIEVCPYGDRTMGTLRSGCTFENLRIMNSGLHGFAGEGENITVRGCSFINIGGCAWNKERRIRFGNAVEFWVNAKNVVVENCTFKNIYDSCVTHQGLRDKTPAAENFICRNNYFENYGMAAFEYRDKLPIASTFENNTCMNAGCGFAMLGEEMPRNSEIYPQPMGHHIFLWRMSNSTPSGGLIIRNNIFGPSPNGAAIYSIISCMAEKQITLEGNKFSKDKLILVHIGGKSFGNISAYTSTTGQDRGAVYID